MTVRDLIRRLKDIPSDWEVSGTGSGSLQVWEPDGPRFGYVFTDERPNKILTSRHGER